MSKQVIRDLAKKEVVKCFFCGNESFFCKNKSSEAVKLYIKKYKVVHKGFLCGDCLVPFTEDKQPSGECIKPITEDVEEHDEELFNLFIDLDHKTRFYVGKLCYACDLAYLETLDDMKAMFDSPDAETIYSGTSKNGKIHVKIPI